MRSNEMGGEIPSLGTARQGAQTRGVNQQRRDERDELKLALEQSMVEELHRQKLEMEKTRRDEEVC